MKRLLLVVLAAVSILASCKSTTTQTKHYAANWDSLAEYNKQPEWFKDAKLGIYFHWGVYSVPAYVDEWYPCYMYMLNDKNKKSVAVRKYHAEKYGEDFEYHEFIPMFKAEKFDAKDWAKLFKEAGAKFAGPVATHHDGYAMWASKVNPWNVLETGPKKDIMREIYDEVRAEGMKTIATFHHARTLQRYAKDTAKWGWSASHYTYRPDRATSTTDPKLKYLYGNIPADEFHEYWLEELREVIEGYDPDIIWFDSWLDRIPTEYRQKMVAMQYNNNNESVVTYKQKDLPETVAVHDIEQGGMETMSKDYWMTDITISYGSWSYTPQQTYKPLDVLIRNMIDVWSKKGVVLLNISPRSDGVIIEDQRKLLHGLGAWLDENGEAVYGTRTYDIFGYGDAAKKRGEFGGQSATTKFSANDVRFTTSKDGETIYAFTLGMPEANSEFTFKNIKNGDKKIKKVSIVGSKTKVDFTLNGEELTVKTPAADKMNDLATVFKIEY